MSYSDTEYSAVEALEQPQISAAEWTRQRLQARLESLSKDWSSFRRNPLGLLGLAIILLFALSTSIHPFLLETVWEASIYDPIKGFDLAYVPHPSGPSGDHLLGTDGFGRDVLSQLIFGARSSFFVGLGAALVAVTVSSLVGGIAGYYGGSLDTIFMGLSDVFVLAPAPIVLLIFGILLRLEIWQVAVLYGLITGLGGQAIVVKSHALSIKAKAYIEAARVSGGGNGHIFRAHVLPALLPLALVHAVFTVVGAVLTEALLSFFARSETVVSWGSMIFLGQRTFRWFGLEGQWNAIIAPAAAIMLFCSAFYLVGRALDEVVNPKLRKR